MKYSFLLPSRLRPNACIDSIQTIYKNASNKKIFEILLAFDEDDETRNDVINYCESSNISYSVLVTKRYGYDLLHAYVNKLCDISNGEYVWYWSDDAHMETKNWDIILEKYTKANPDLAFDFTMGYPFSFPLVPKKYIDAMKHFSLNTHIDSWIELLLKPYNLTMIIHEIKVFHNRHEGSGNSMQINYEDVNKSVLKTHPDFCGTFCTMLRQVDQNRIARNLPHLNLPLTQLPYENNRIGIVGIGNRGLYVAIEIANNGHFVLGYDTNPIFNEYTTTEDIMKEYNINLEYFKSVSVNHKQLKLTKDFQLILEFSEVIFIDEPLNKVENTLSNIISICQQLNLVRTIIILAKDPLFIDQIILPNSINVSICSMTNGLQNPPKYILLNGNEEKIHYRLDSFYKTITSPSVIDVDIPNNNKPQKIIKKTFQKIKNISSSEKKMMPLRLQKYLKKNKQI